MIFTARGIKAWIIGLVVLAVVIIVLVLLFHLLIFLLPVILIFVLLSYLFKMLNKFKKGDKKDFIDVKFKVRKRK